MQSLYIHIPFCKKACHYCSFYFVLSQVKKKEFVHVICNEIEKRKYEVNKDKISTIYFGGGTPSLFSHQDLRQILDTIYRNYKIDDTIEICIETNPENLSLDYLNVLNDLSINRLSIGVQSFFDEDLALMNRNHNAHQAIAALTNASKLFDNISLDLMFGLPYSGMERWQNNLQIAVDLGVQHISTYNLTVEEKTALAKKVSSNELKLEEDNTLNEMYFYTIDFLESKGWKQYEISNFAQKGFESKHNWGYWTGQKYLGFGPSAHSYDGEKRKWNISNLNNYIDCIQNGTQYWEEERLSIENKYNEYIMIGLRTILGVDISKIRTNFAHSYAKNFELEVQQFIENEQIIKEENIYRLTHKGKLMADYIASQLMTSSQ